MKAKKRNSKKLISVSGVAVLIVAILGLGVFFGLKAYDKHQANKIYSVGDTVKLPDFNFKVTKAVFKPVDLPIDQKTVAKYGAITTPENCDALSKAPTMEFVGNPTPVPYGPSAYNICVRRNDSRNEISKYSADNKQLTVNYEVVARNNVSTSRLRITLDVDSGRKLNEQVNAFNGNQFFDGGAQELNDFLGVPTYSPEVTTKYIPYHQSDIGGDIDKGLTRSGYTYTDIRNSEHTVDVKVTYYVGGKLNTRIVRVTRQ